jgi:hypothetical protein
MAVVTEESENRKNNYAIAAKSICSLPLLAVNQ